MGRGNVCVHNPYEGLFYIDNDYLDIFRKKGSDPEEPELRARGQLNYEELCSAEWEFDKNETELSWQCDKDNLKYYINKRFPSFLPVRSISGSAEETLKRYSKTSFSISASKITSGAQPSCFSRRNTGGTTQAVSRSDIIKTIWMASETPFSSCILNLESIPVRGRMER